MRIVEIVKALRPFVTFNEFTNQWELTERAQKIMMYHRRIVQGD